MADDFDYEAHERLRDRVANKADSVLWTYKAHYEAADYYEKWGRRMDFGTTFGAGAVTIALVWEALPQIVPLSIAILTAVLAGYKTASKPHKQADEHYRAGDAYHRLFEEFRDYIKLELAEKSTGLSQMENRFEELSERRRELNEDMPNMTSKWYSRLDEEEIRGQVSTTEEQREALTGCAKLND